MKKYLFNVTVLFLSIGFCFDSLSINDYRYNYQDVSGDQNERFLPSGFTDHLILWSKYVVTSTNKKNPLHISSS
ncbi:MAG: hypothetical protein WBQ73_03730 [Candidatus Babeliales bacterium]